jgi:hypothetical protein
MAPDLILVVAGLSAAWAVFSIVGGERQRVLQNAELLRRSQPAAGEEEEVIDLGKSAPAAAPAKKAA